MLSAPGPPGPPVVRGRGSHLGVSGREGGGGWRGGVRFTAITEWPEFTVRPEVGGQAESTGRVVFYIVAPT